MRPKGVMVFGSPGSDPCASRNGTRVAALEVVANRPIVHHVLDALVSAGVRELIALVPAPLLAEAGECIRAYGDPVARGLRCVELAADSGLASGLVEAAPIVGSSACVVHCANGLVGEPLAPFVDQLQDGGADVVLLVHEGATGKERLSEASRRLLHVAELDPERTALGVTGVCLLGEGALSQAARAQWDSGPEVDLAAVADRVVAGGGVLHTRVVDTWRCYNGEALDLLELNRIALDDLEPDVSQGLYKGNLIEGRVQIDETAQIQGSVIVGPTIIGPGARIADAYIGPYTSIGGNVRIEGVEVERSIISPGASVMHVGGRLVASVVGRDARVFRDFSLPRAFRLRVSDGDEVALC